MADQHDPEAPSGHADDARLQGDAEAAAARLERALERIAARAQASPAGSEAPDDGLVEEVAGRLDSLIEQVRAALAAPGSAP